MNFFFKSDTIVLDCFTDNPFIYETARINQAVKFLPDWWRKLPPPKSIELKGDLKNFNLKTCPGFRDLYKKSLVLPLWSEFKIKVLPDGSYEWKAANQATIQSHLKVQYDGLFSNVPLAQLKILSPWFVRSKSDLQLMFLEPFFNNTNLNDLRIIPGVLNTKYVTQLNVNCFIEPNPDDVRSINLSPLTPLTFLVPLTEKKIELRHHLITTKETMRFTENLSFPGFNLLSKRIKNFDKVEELNKKDSKCPFGFK